MKQTTDDLLREQIHLLKKLIYNKGIIDDNIHYHNGLACNQKH